MTAYYNEHDPKAAAWLRELIAANLIAPGDVDERSIVDVRPRDLAGYGQCHFFAGIGGWSYALRLAGWPDERVVWTGSCPCQPFSSAGKGRGKDDARHLWPQFRRLIRQRRPAIVFGEQVASAAGRVWLSAVFADLEALAYRAAGADLCGPSVGAFDIRQRLWFVADTEHAQRRPLGERRENGRHGQDDGRQEAHGQSRARGQVRVVADGNRGRCEVGPKLDGCQEPYPADGNTCGSYAGRRRDVGELGDSGSQGLSERVSDGRLQRDQVGAYARQTAQRGGDSSFWGAADWIPCSDGKWRPVEPGTFPLAHGVPARVGRLRGYGNAIKPQVAAEFISAYLEATAGSLGRAS